MGSLNEPIAQKLKKKKKKLNHAHPCILGAESANLQMLYH